MTKKITLTSYVLWFSLILTPLLSEAHPTSYEGGVAFMTRLHPKIQEASLIYSPKYWLGTGLVSMRSPDKSELTAFQVAWLVNRWNLPEAQGNLYLLGGLGYGKRHEVNSDSNGPEGSMYRFGIQADFETRRLYTFIRYLGHRFTNENEYLSDQFSAAVGFAPYLGEFDGLNSWVIFKFIASEEFNSFIYLPMLRFFYGNFLWEVGQDLDGNSQLNFMVRF